MRRYDRMNISATKVHPPRFPTGGGRGISTRPSSSARYSQNSPLPVPTPRSEGFGVGANGSKSLIAAIVRILFTCSAALPIQGAVAAEANAPSKLPAEVVARLGAHRFVHHGRLQNVAFSPDGTAIFAVTEDEACLWDARTGDRRTVFELPREHQTIMCGAMSRDGKTAILAENGPLLFLFDVATGQRKAILRGAQQRALTIALNSDGSVAASGDHNDVILWDTAGAKELRRCPFPSSVAALQFSPDDKRLAIATRPEGGDMWIQNIGGNDVPLRLEGTTGFSPWLAFSPDGKTVAGSCELPTSREKLLPLRVWDANTGRMLFGIPRRTGCGIFSPDGRWLTVGISPFGMHEAAIFDARTGEERHRLPLGHDHIRALAFSPDGRTLATAMDRRIQLWNTETWKELNPGSGHAEPVQTLAFAPDGKTLASGGLDGSLILWSWPEGKEIRRIEKMGSHRGVQRLAFAPDSRRIVATAWVNGGDMINVCDATSGTIVSKFGRLNGGYGAVFGWDGKEILVGTSNGSIEIWDAASGVWKRAVGHSKGTICALQPMAGGSKVWWASEYQGLGLRDLVTGKDERFLAGSSLYYDTNFAVSPDGNWLAVGSRVWDLKTGETIAPGMPGQVTFAASSPDGRLLATIWRDDVVFWEVLTRQEIHRLQIATRPVKALAFSPDSTVLAVAANAEVLVWDMTGRLRDRQLQGIELTREEMESFWQSLGGKDAWAAHRAAWTLAAAGQAAVEFLTERLRPAAIPTPAQVKALRDRLGDPDYDVREHAARELQDMGVEVRPEDREALRRPEPTFGNIPGEKVPVRLMPPPVLLPLPERVRASRAVMALERSRAPGAKSLLEALSAGASCAPLTDEAKSALDRVRRRN